MPPDAKAPADDDRHRLGSQSGKELATFLVNGDSKVGNVGDVVTYADICTLADHDPGMYPTVTVSRMGAGGGTMRTGQIKTIQGGEVFSVAHTSGA